MNYDVIIIGAGASGLVAAIAAARKGSSVLVIEQKEKAGKKILATGNGKCNYTNMLQKPECYRSNDSTFAMKVLHGFDVQSTIDFFEALGIHPKEKNGYFYPHSEQAASVVEVLLMECKRLRVHFSYGEKVIAVREPDYTIITEQAIPNLSGAAGNANKRENKKSYYAVSLILATGGCASPKLGSDGSGYPLARQYGHTIIKPLPALVALKSPAKYCKTLSGVRTIARVTAYTCPGNEDTEDTLKPIAEEEGEIIFTDYGISGIPVMELSRFVSKALDQQEKVNLKIDFLIHRKPEEIITLLKRRIEQNPRKNLEEMMVGLLNHKLSYVLIKEAKLLPEQNTAQLSEKDIRRLAKAIKEFWMPVNAPNSFDNAQVSAGGVSTAEINERTMESKMKKHLYLTGELVDVDGTCGGYNLQWAWSSGYLAGTAAGNR